MAAAALLLTVGAAVAGLWFEAGRSRPGDPLARFALPIGARVRFTGAPAISPDGTTIVYPPTMGRSRASNSTSAGSTRLRRSGCLAPRWREPVLLAGWGVGRVLGRQHVEADAPGWHRLARDHLRGGVVPRRHVDDGWNDRVRVDQQWPAAGRCGRRRAAGPQRHRSGPCRRSTITRRRCCPAAAPMLVTVHEGERRFRIDVLMLGTGARRTIIDDGFDARYRLDRPHRLRNRHCAVRRAVRPRAPRAIRAAGAAAGRCLDRSPRGTRAPTRLSDTGTLVFLPLPPPARRHTRMGRPRRTSTPLPLEPRAYWTPRLSPDGRRFAVVVEDQETAKIWIHRFDNGTFSRLTSDGRNWAPVWSRDGSHLIYVSERDGSLAPHTRGLDGARLPKCC